MNALSFKIIKLDKTGGAFLIQVKLMFIAYKERIKSFFFFY